MVLLLMSREYRFVFPAVLLAKGLGSAVGWYFGAAIQLGIGGWLLGWPERIQKRSKQNSINTTRS
jgi:hypothetical protein